jgi:hypothetical protein
MVNKQYASKYTSLANLVNTVNRSLAAHALTARWTHSQEGGMIGVTCVLSHAAGHSEEVTLHGPPDDSGAKNNLQKIKSTLTYLKAATFEAVTGIASREGNEDDDGNSSGEIPKPAKIGPKRMRKIVEGLLSTTKAGDGPGLLLIWDELESDEKLSVWSELRSWERSAIKELLNKAKAAGCGMQLDAWSKSLLRECTDDTALTSAFKAITEAYAANGVAELPEDVILVCDEMRASMGAA